APAVRDAGRGALGRLVAPRLPQHRGVRRPAGTRCRRAAGARGGGCDLSLILCDVGPRDGLQNETVALDPAARAELCDRLLSAGVRSVEAASFVNPRLVPQMAGAEEVLAAVARRPGTVLSGLALNERGFARALAAGV